jgi:uncharacterized damage-inducible protein DinB
VKALLQQYAAYNVWANQLIIEKILSLPEENQQQVLPGSFPSLYKTLLHMWDAESIWWQRVKMFDVVNRPSDHYKGNTKDVAEAVTSLDRQWAKWIDSASGTVLDHVFHYQNSKKEKFRQPTFEMLLHLFNHNTYHRGQLVTMLRSLGVEGIPATDFIVFARRKK